MIAAWMLSALVAGGLLTLAAHAAGRASTAMRVPTRFAWLGAMVITAIWPAIVVLRDRLTPSASATAFGAGSVQRFAAIVVRASEGAAHLRLDTILLLCWGVVTALLLARMLHAMRALDVHGRGWRTRHVDGVEVKMSPDVGPAVVGLTSMDVVLPEWILGLDESLRALVLAHEGEHRRARDPQLLLAATILTALVPWNLALWWQSRRLRLAIELDCDARVLRARPHPDRYGRLLLAIAQRRAAGSVLLTPALSEPVSSLEHRIDAMHHHLTSSRARIVALGIVAVMALVAACSIDAPTKSGTAKVAAAKDLTAPAPVYYDFQVTKSAQQVPGGKGPEYPAMLKTAGVVGEVQVQFVVNADGRVDTSTFKVLKSAHPLFTEAVRAWLPDARFTPATVNNGMTVKQLVQMPFVFALK